MQTWLRTKLMAVLLEKQNASCLHVFVVLPWKCFGVTFRRCRKSHVFLLLVCYVRSGPCQTRCWQLGFVVGFELGVTKTAQLVRTVQGSDGHCFLLWRAGDVLIPWRQQNPLLCSWSLCRALPSRGAGGSAGTGCSMYWLYCLWPRSCLTSWAAGCCSSMKKSRWNFIFAAGSCCFN